jgi:cation transport ATPase
MTFTPLDLPVFQLLGILCTLTCLGILWDLVTRPYPGHARYCLYAVSLLIIGCSAALFLAIAFNIH